MFWKGKLLKVQEVWKVPDMGHGRGRGRGAAGWGANQGDQEKGL